MLLTVLFFPTDVYHGNFLFENPANALKCQGNFFVWNAPVKDLDREVERILDEEFFLLYFMYKFWKLNLLNTEGNFL